MPMDAIALNAGELPLLHVLMWFIAGNTWVFIE